jgi:hypothetical protein
MMEARQRKADAYIADYLERHGGEHHDALRAALKRPRTR